MRQAFSGTSLREHRLRAGLPITLFAARCGISSATLVRYEAGATAPPVATLSAMAEVLGIDMAELLEEAPHDAVAV